MIEYRDVHKAFDDTPVLEGVSLTIETGECLSIVGPSGTGKSVLLKMTNGLLEPDQGDVFVDGEAVFQATRRQLESIRRKVGYVFQNAALFDSMTVCQNVSQGLPDDEARRCHSPPVLAKVCAALDAVNLEPSEILGELPASLSGGMRKRVGLARAIIGRPQILLYDEPSTGLDPVNSAVITLLIKDIQRRMQVTSVVVTHDIQQAFEISARIALLQEGKLHFVGTPDAFRASDDPAVQAFANRQAAAVRAAEIMEVS